MKIHILYFSATYTTRTVCQGIARHLGSDVVGHDVTNVSPQNEVDIPENDLLIVGMPVYCGRIPEMAVERIRKFHGHHTKAIVVAVYGNRAYDDALIEMTQLVAKNDFKVIGAAAFIGKHCIFPKVASERPDAADQEQMKLFASLCMPLLLEPYAHVGMIKVPGNPDLRPHKRVPFYPLPTENCINCGTCAALCPTGAISLNDASVVNKDLCIACGRCIDVCNCHGRRFVGEVYDATAEKFEAANCARKEPEFFLAQVL